MSMHQPKGSMCMACSNGSAACGQRDFSSMPVIQVYPDGVKAVKCNGHRAAQPAHLEEGQGLPCGH